jgi:hypothetical protein
MATHKPGFSIIRTLKLLGVFFAIPLSVLLVLKVYDAISGQVAAQAAAEDAEAKQVGAPNTPPPVNALGPKDDFYRIMVGGIQANDAAGLSSIQLSHGGALHNAFRLFVKKDDVIARTKGYVNKGSWSYNPFASGWGGPYWSEAIEWCIRLRMPPGEEKMFAYTLWQLSDLAFSESLGLTRLTTDQRLTPETALNFINLDNKKELLIPIRTSWSGKSEKEVSIREWFIAPDSKVCSQAAKK